MHILFEISIGKNRELNSALLVFVIISLLLVLQQKQTKNAPREGVWVVTAYLATGILGTAFYEHTIFDHYIAYLFPVTFLVYGVVLDYWARKHFLFKLGAVLFFAFFLIYNSERFPLRSLGWTLNDIHRTSQSILEHLDPDEKYNIVLLATSGDIDGQNYRYFLSTTDHPPVPLAERGSVDTLVIINEDKMLEKVTDSPIYEIVVFPHKNPDTVYNIVDGPEITILRKK